MRDLLDGGLLGDPVVLVVALAYGYEALEADEVVGRLAGRPFRHLGSGVADGLLLHEPLGGAEEVADLIVRILEQIAHRGDKLLRLLVPVDVREERQLEDVLVEGFARQRLGDLQIRPARAAREFGGGQRLDASHSLVAGERVVVDHFNEHELDQDRVRARVQGRAHALVGLFEQSRDVLERPLLERELVRDPDVPYVR